VAQNQAESVRWFRMAADQGDRDAQYNLGTIYAKGQGVKPDGQEAVKWYLKAASQGDVDSQYMLGVRYATGKDVPQDPVEAYRWFSLAASQGAKIAADELQKIAATMTPAQISAAQDKAGPAARPPVRPPQRVSPVGR